MLSSSKYVGVSECEGVKSRALLSSESGVQKWSVSTEVLNVAELFPSYLEFLEYQGIEIRIIRCVANGSLDRNAAVLTYLVLLFH